jgi:hypothetical protein
VQQCLVILTFIAEEARNRNRHLDIKAGSVAGFAATALTLNLTLGRPLLLEHFNGPAHSWIRDFFLGSAVMFACAVFVTAIGVLRPMPTDDIDEAAIDAYADRPKATTPPAALREVWLQSMKTFAIADRASGDEKAKWSKWAARLLGLGIVGLLGEAFVLGVVS